MGRLLELSSHFLKALHTAPRPDHGLKVREPSHSLCDCGPAPSPLWASVSMAMSRGNCPSLTGWPGRQIRGAVKLLASAPLHKHWVVATVIVSSYFIQETEVRLTEPTSPGFSSFRRISGMGFVVRCFFSPQDNQD